MVKNLSSSPLPPNTRSNKIRYRGDTGTSNGVYVASLVPKLPPVTNLNAKRSSENGMYTTMILSFTAPNRNDIEFFTIKYKPEIAKTWKTYKSFVIPSIYKTNWSEGFATTVFGDVAGDGFGHIWEFQVTYTIRYTAQESEMSSVTSQLYT